MIFAATPFPWSDLRPTVLSFVYLAIAAGVLFFLITVGNGLPLRRLFTTHFWPTQRHRAVPWTFLDLMVILILFLGIELLLLPIFKHIGQTLAATPDFAKPTEVQRFAGSLIADTIAARHLGSPWTCVLNTPTSEYADAVFVSEYRWLHIGMVVCRVFCCIAFTVYLMLHTGARPFNFLLTTFQWRQNLWRGYLTWFAVTLPLTYLYVLLLRYAEVVGTKTQHPVETFLALTPWSGDYVLALLLTVVISPAAEELLMRGIIQPLFIDEPMLADSFILMALVLAIGYGLSESSLLDENKAGWAWGPIVFLVLVGPGYLAFEWLTRRLLPKPGAARGIFAVALLFALLHSSVWPSPVPIFLLGVALGYLAYRTQSLTGCFVAHALFNAVSMLTTFVARA